MSATAKVKRMTNIYFFIPYVINQEVAIKIGMSPKIAFLRGEN